ncbi:caspase, EACC1-associated type [Streptomyces sp. NBC_01358]|uniref:caspase, EACC1-associated type n=1 Tax=Streptomyces sp. NBC_01358 TaxID=2903837 RepID=UPI002E308443|nr:SAV_2336 N-terminal domain-related protein [Streptomyces sp. NBC_01358]
MADHAAALLARLALAGGSDIDVKELLDAVLLASAWDHAGRGHGTSPDSAYAATQLKEQGKPENAAPTVDAQSLGNGDAMDAAREPAASVWLEDQTGTQIVPGRRVTLGRATAFPNALDIGRALRPLRRPWLSGVHQRLDIDATVEHYARTGMLVPQLAPAPEPWLEVVVVLDRGTAMAVWDETVRALTKTLHALATFRDVRVWHLEHPPGDDPVLHDHQGRALPIRPNVAHHTQPARRLLLVVTDCAAPAWRQDTLWRTLYAWGRTSPVALINPLPKRLWQRSGLDLPHTTARATVPAAPSRLLSYRRPRLLRETQDTKPWQALPVMQFDPAQILAWARTLMRIDPSGCDAVLVPATGRPPLRRHLPGPTLQLGDAPTSNQVRAHAEAFTDDRQSPAVRLAIAASPLGSFTLPVLDVLRDRLVPDATLADTSEFLTAGLLTATRRVSADTMYQFHPAAAALLTNLLTRDQLWDTHFALSDHLAAHLQTPHGIPVTLRSPNAGEAVPTGNRPIAYAAATTARLLGVEPADHLPETGRSPAANRPAGSSNRPQHESALTISKMPEDRTQAKELYRTLARHFRSLLAWTASSRAVRSSGPEQHETLLETAGASGQDRQQARTNDGSPELTKAHHELVISVDVRKSGAYNAAGNRQMRDQVHGVLSSALTLANVASDAVYMEDRGDGFLMSVANRIPANRLLGPWLVNVHESLRDENRGLRVPLGLRIGMHAGAVLRDGRGLHGRAINLACRLADSTVARHLLDTEKADLVLVTSQSLYEDVVSSGGRLIEPARYSSTQLQLREGEVTAWFHLPGRAAPVIPDLATPEQPASVDKSGAAVPETQTLVLERRREFPDLAASRAVFVGVGSYESADLPQLPSVQQGAAAIQQAFTHQQPDICFTEGSTRLLINPEDPRDVLRAVAEAADEAEDTLLIYYAGHGLVSRHRGDLLLSTTTTEPNSDYTAIAYSNLRDILATSPAKRKVVILDCCFSGGAMAGVPGSPLVAVESASTYVLAATAADRGTLALAGEEHPRFTGALLDLLTTGEPGGPELWTMEGIYRSLRRQTLAQTSLQPTLLATNSGTALALGRNPAWRKPDESAAEPPGSGESLYRAGGIPPGSETGTAQRSAPSG